MNKPEPKFVRDLEVNSFMSENDVPIIVKDTPNGPLTFFGFGSTAEFRARTLLTKEPETIAWIDSFEPDGIFWDIGANIGVYSLFAALKLKKVMAFEPSAFNYYLLNKNIYLNGLDKKIDTFNIAFSNITGLDYLYLSSVESAGGANSFAVKEDACGDAMNVAYRQSCFGLTIDDFISQYNLSTPNYIKIDVDGIELLIIKGGGDTFLDQSLQSVLIEVNENKKSETDDICAFMKRCGFKEATKRHPPDFDDAYYKPFFNYIFERR